MCSEAPLIFWTALALAWWVTAWRLVAARPAKGGPAEGVAEDRPLTIFKPLAPLEAGDFREARGIESFLAQLDATDELLLGAHRQDRSRVEPFVERMRAAHPRARLAVVWGDEPDTVANPKVAWLKVLAPHATGELWLWSDADIAAPPGFLRTARAEYAAGGARLLTWPYVVREAARAPALLDALFVNAEFFPGVLLLRRLGPVDFGLGAALLFSRADFEARVDWEELGRALADDFVLGQKMRPVRIGLPILSTEADAGDWRAAILHYLRWSKTVRWNRPVGTAARLAVLPMLGWMAMAAARPDHLFGWLGLVATVQMDVFFVLLIFRHIGCPLGVRHLAVVKLWSLARPLVWLLGWLPGPVTWRGRSWRGPFCRSDR